MGDLVMVTCVCRHNDCGRSCDGERPVFVGTMTVGDGYRPCVGTMVGDRPVFVGTMTVGDLVMVNGLCL